MNEGFVTQEWYKKAGFRAKQKREGSWHPKNNKQTCNQHKSTWEFCSLICVTPHMCWGKCIQNVACHKTLCFHLPFSPLTALLIILLRYGMVRTYGTLVTASTVSSFPLSGMHVERDKLLTIHRWGRSHDLVPFVFGNTRLSPWPTYRAHLPLRGCSAVGICWNTFTRCHPYDCDVRLLVI